MMTLLFRSSNKQCASTLLNLQHNSNSNSNSSRHNSSLAAAVDTPLSQQQNLSFFTMMPPQTAGGGGASTTTLVQCSADPSLNSYRTEQSQLCQSSNDRPMSRTSKSYHHQADTNAGGSGSPSPILHSKSPTPSAGSQRNSVTVSTVKTTPGKNVSGGSFVQLTQPQYGAPLSSVLIDGMLPLQLHDDKSTAITSSSIGMLHNINNDSVTSESLPSLSRKNITVHHNGGGGCMMQLIPTESDNNDNFSSTIRSPVHHDAGGEVGVYSLMTDDKQQQQQQSTGRPPNCSSKVCKKLLLPNSGGGGVGIGLERQNGLIDGSNADYADTPDGSSNGEASYPSARRESAGLSGGGGSLLRKGLTGLFQRALRSNFSTSSSAAAASSSDGGGGPAGLNVKFDRRYSRPIKVFEFIDRVSAVEDADDDADEPFAKEYESFRYYGRDKPCNAASLPSNMQKNRFSNILPFDHSRVVLQPSSSPDGNSKSGGDYINASYVPGFYSRREFIATQGPLQHTRNDFWRMVWQQDTRAIVMLTRLVEGDQEKCVRYWPENMRRPTSYGDVEVMLLGESHFENGSWTVREFSVSADGDSRTVHQWHFLNWSDFSVPDDAAAAAAHNDAGNSSASAVIENIPLLKFLHAFRHQHPPGGSEAAGYGPIVCHCSAGVGRSGTFITIDRILQQLSYAEQQQRQHHGQQQHQQMLTQVGAGSSRPPRWTHCGITSPPVAVGSTTHAEYLQNLYGSDMAIDVMGIVCDMRRERCSMVQTEHQYKFIYHCIKNVLESRCVAAGVRMPNSEPDPLQRQQFQHQYSFSFFNKQQSQQSSSSSSSTGRPRHASGIVSGSSNTAAAAATASSTADVNRNRHASGGS